MHGKIHLENFKLNDKRLRKRLFI